MMAKQKKRRGTRHSTKSPKRKRRQGNELPRDAFGRFTKSSTNKKSQIIKKTRKKKRRRKKTRYFKNL